MPLRLMLDRRAWVASFGETYPPTGAVSGGDKRLVYGPNIEWTGVIPVIIEGLKGDLVQGERLEIATIVALDCPQWR